MEIFDRPDSRLRTPEELSGPALLRDIAHQSGGKMFEMKDLAELPNIAKIGKALRSLPPPLLRPCFVALSSDFVEGTFIPFPESTA